MTLSRSIHVPANGSMWGFSGFSEQGPLFVVTFGLLIAGASSCGALALCARGLLIAGASLVVEHGLCVRGFL